MQTFHFHVLSGGQLILDEEGSCFQNYSEALREATLSAREIVAEAIWSGEPVVPDAIVIADESGKELGTLPMSSVLPKAR